MFPTSRYDTEMQLGVNIDHIATVRQARGGNDPDPVAAAAVAERAGAMGITVHLREDRRHIQDRDVELLLQTVMTKVNLEMSLAPEIVAKACAYAPQCACIVPERREEVTTEGGLDVKGQLQAVKDATVALTEKGTVVSLFIDPEPGQIESAAESGAPFIELHTGAFANAQDEAAREKELATLIRGAELARKCGLRVNAGHGLNYHNVHLMHRVPDVEELNIGHAIISRALFTGLEIAVRDMVSCIT